MELRRIYEQQEPEYQLLSDFVDILNKEAQDRNIPALFYIQDVYLDFGQNWKWTTICTAYTNPKNKQQSTYQTLSPADYEKIILNKTEYFTTIIRHIIKSVSNFTGKNYIDPVIKYVVLQTDNFEGTTVFINDENDKDLFSLEEAKEVLKKYTFDVCKDMANGDEIYKNATFSVSEYLHTINWSDETKTYTEILPIIVRNKILTNK